ncbi:MAG: hypothetical protein MjAS7_2017 [Metallosphaera javensis (ex Sakai et al. 2022)]|nr:MAG: hypothetical protein MjAS7_2017 [Metallosphaera javensis (ex Sakai et al. 2022)]
MLSLQGQKPTFQTLKGSLQTTLALLRKPTLQRFQTLKGSLQTLCHCFFFLLVIIMFQTLKGSLQTKRTLSYQDFLNYSFKPSKDLYKRPILLPPRYCRNWFQTLKGSLQTLFFFLSSLPCFSVSNPQRISTNTEYGSVTVPPGVCFKPSKDLYKLGTRD